MIITALLVGVALYGGWKLRGASDKFLGGPGWRKRLK